MVGVEQLESQGIVVRYIKSILKVQVTLVHSAVRQRYLTRVPDTLCTLAYDAGREWVNFICLL
jgi:hypothetical protein